MPKTFQVLFFDPEQPVPCYHLIGEVKAETAESAINEHLDELTAAVRRQLDLGPDFPDSRIRSALYLADFENLIPVPVVIPVPGS
ncbi:MAG: hypothetical protein N2248_07340 [candidate division WOR-3 bacterium]|uniref:Uncharacterized protein n=1 Tax=candidate division WOR-3 bacterium TaxID=2052148 RepID=A0A7C1WIN9_UNCW3|nr:hypothetical protein [candidate division WOR-3 bacterium]